MHDPFDRLRAHFSRLTGVTVSAGKGAQGMKLGKQMFAMFYKGQLVLRLPPQRVAELVGSEEGQSFDPGTGKPMKDWVMIPATRSKSWIELAEEARKHAASRARTAR